MADILSIDAAKSISMTLRTLVQECNALKKFGYDYLRLPRQEALKKIKRLTALRGAIVSFSNQFSKMGASKKSKLLLSFDTAALYMGRIIDLINKPSASIDDDYKQLTRYTDALMATIPAIERKLKILQQLIA
ncbi:hypothetical protein KY346_06025 [Candidatus Woesearchaeota archaeon]|nr:hypothetical protein [Candidatus Woesearchaeota archaeon]